MKHKLSLTNIFVLAVLLANCASPVGQVAAPVPQPPLRDAAPTVPIADTAAKPIDQPLPITARGVQPLQNTSISDDLTGTPKTDPPLDDFPPGVTGKREIVEQRTADSVMFDMGDGSYTLVQEARPMHYRDQQGQWQRIDPALAPVGQGWLNTTNSLSTVLAPRSSVANLRTGLAAVGWEPRRLQVVSADNSFVTLAEVLSTTQALTGTLSADRRTVNYAGSWSDAAIQDRWQTGFGSSEYSLRLTARPDPKGLDSLELRVSLHLFPGTRIQVDGQAVSAANLPLETRGELAFVNDQGDALLLQPPCAYEEAGRSASVAGSYRLEAGAEATTVELGVRIPWNWLAAAERQFPVVIDPVFQVKTASSTRSIRYYSASSYTWGALNPASVAVGYQSVGVDRVLVRLPLPSLPPGATIVNATLEAMPSDALWLGQPDWVGSAQVAAYSLLNDNWWMQSTPSSPPLVGASLGTLRMEHSAGKNPLGQSVASWNITSLATSWLMPGQNNHGILLKLEPESCSCNGGYCNFCGGFVFPNPSNYRAHESAIGDFSRGNGGIRLVVNYTGPTLFEGQVMEGMLGIPLPSSDTLYFSADHEYRLDALPDNRWQAVIARGLGATAGITPQLQFGDVYRWDPQGSMEMELRNSSDSILHTQSPKNRSLSYFLLDGHHAAGQPTNRVRVKPQSLTDSNAVAPLKYDVRLIKEQSSKDVPLNTPFIFEGEFDSRNPMALWNVNLPSGSNSRVDIEITGHNYLDSALHPVGGYYDYVKGFSAQLFESWAPPDYWYQGYERAFRPLGNNWQDPIAYGTARMTSGIFPAKSDPYALALAYNGPATSLWSYYKCGEFTCSHMTPLTFSYRVRITACGNGMFPTNNGTCQQIKCPTNRTPNRRIGGGWQLWSEEGWTSLSAPATSTAVAIAPMLGPIVLTDEDAPRVAVVGGQISYNDFGYVSVTADSNVLLVNCRSLSNPVNPVTLNDYFPVFQGAMRRQLVSRTPELAPFGAGTIKNFDPWRPLDRDDFAGHKDVSAETFYVDPDAGRANGGALLTRRTGNDLSFSTSYWVDVGGWTSLHSSISQNGTNDPPPIVGLALDLGSIFSLDTSGSTGKFAARQFEAVRAISATITQPANLGGASKQVQALIIGVGASIPSESPQICGGSCVDLRALDDAPGQPDRLWQMPDIHTNVGAGMVAVSTQGKLQVWSTDHPAMPAGAQAISQQFSFDTFGASVTVENGKCGNVNNVTILRGETRMVIPMIGDASSPDSVVNAKFTLCQAAPPGGDVTLRQVSFEFYSPIGIPIGSTGLFVTAMNGSVDILPDKTTITFGLDFQAAQGGDGGILKGHGQVTISTEGLFSFQGAGKLLGRVDASGQLWVAWNPLDTGFDMSLGYDLGDAASLTGQVRAHMWQGRGWQNRYSWLPNNDEKHFSAQIAATLTIYEDAIMPFVPPSDIPIGVEVAFGQFCTNDSCTEYEWGFKALVTIVGYDVGVYYGFDEGLDLILGNDDHVLIDQYDRAVQSAGSPSADAEPGGVRVQAAPQAVNGNVTLPVTVTDDTENLLIGLTWQAGALQLRLNDPNGRCVVCSYVDPTTPWLRSNVTHTLSFSYTTRTDAAAGTISNILIGVRLDPARHPLPGIWHAEISGVTDQAHYKFIFFANKGAPGTPDNRGSFIKPYAPIENATGLYTIRWAVLPDRPISSTISLYYHKFHQDPDRHWWISDGREITIIKNLRYSAGSYTWDTSWMANGYYGIKAVVDDGVNAFPDEAARRRSDPCQPGSELLDPRAFDSNRFPGVSIFSSEYDAGFISSSVPSGTIAIDDTTPPLAPTGVTALGQDGALLVRWNPSPEKDLAAYWVFWARGYRQVLPPFTFVPTGEYGQERVAATISPTLRINGLKNDLGTLEVYAVSIRAIDASENIGAGSAFAYARTTGDSNSQVPMSPLTPTVTFTSSTSATLMWFRPSGPAPTSYRLIYRQPITFAPVTQVDVWPNPLLPFVNKTISGLEPGVTYEAMVSAGNSQGWHSAYSPKVRFITTNGVDTDRDGMPDDWEAAHNIGGLFTLLDLDGDGLSNVLEYQAGTDPRSQDSDKDGFSDAEELEAGTDPLYDTSYPARQTQPRLELWDHQLTFYAKQGLLPPAPQYVRYFNDGGGTMKLRASDSSTWITPTICGTAGSLPDPGCGNNVAVTVNPSGLAPGFYSGVVRLYQATSGDPLIGQAQCIRVNLHLLRADNDIPATPAAVMVNPTALNLAEGGRSVTYTLTLNSMPNAPVTVTLSNDTQVTVNPTRVVFAARVKPGLRTVTVTAVDDAVAEGNHISTIKHSVSSADANFNGLRPYDVIASIADNDSADVYVSEASVDVVEGGPPANYRVVLTLKPTANVTITIAGDSQANASPTRLVFTPANWNTPQTVAVRGMADGLVEGPHIGIITHHAVSGDGNYNGIYISSVTVNIVDRRFLYLPRVLR